MTNFNDVHYIILAAGKGSRMNSTKAKILHKIFHTPIIELLVKNTIKSNLNKINMVISEDGKEIKEHFHGQDNIDYIIQKERLGTGDAVKIALDNSKIPDQGVLIILYGDTPFITEETIVKLVKKIKSGYLGAVAAFRFEPENQYGRLLINGEKLERIIEFKEANQSQREIKLCNSGIMALDLTHARELLNKIDNNNLKQEYYLTDVIEEINNINQQASFVEIDYLQVQGINNKFELANATKYYFATNRERALLQGVTLIDPDSCYLGHDIEFGQDVVIEPNVTIYAKSKIGNKVTIKSYSYIETTIIESDVTIGPYARIRPNSHIDSMVKIGNFVEIKNSKIKKSSKINHLSYIGDSEIGESVNIGAGTITCNYDGVKKHKTIIEDEVFIGSNSALIAPLNIGSASIIGAGSTITSDIKQNSVIIARSEQKKIADAREFKKKKRN